MKQLVSKIPLLYCLLYYKTSPQNGTDKMQSSQRLFQDQKTEHFVRMAGRTDQSNVNFDSSSDERPWMYHNRHRELANLCSTAYDQYLYRKESRATVCSMMNLNDVRKLFPDNFISEADLQKIILRLHSIRASERHGSNLYSVIRYAVEPRVQEAQKSDVQGGTHCGICLTEVGYEVLAEVTDFKGDNHTVINFHNAYQFVPSGRCLNENHHCGGGNARCKQIYRAHWTLVWSGVEGVQLVAHEVPSHCECMNVGSFTSHG